MHLGRSNHVNAYTLNGIQLGIIEQEKDLGILVTSKLSSSTQSQAAAAKATTILRRIKRVKLT